MNTSELKALKEAIQTVDTELTQAIARGSLTKAIECIQRRDTLTALLITVLERLAS